MSSEGSELMLHSQSPGFWRAVAQYVSGTIALAFVTFVCFRLGLNLATTACIYLIVIVLLSLRGSFLLSVVFSLIGVACLAYYFAPPDLSFRVSDPFDAMAIIAFLTTSAVITHLVSRVRKSAERLREQAALLDLTHDTIFVRDVNDVITYWNRGAEELYGWTRNEAVGKNSHDLNQTVFPAPLEDIKAELIRTGRWEGDLIHTRRAGTKVVVASRWSLQRDDQGRPAGTLETNNDITERKRAEEALQQVQAELAHVTRVTALGDESAIEDYTGLATSVAYAVTALRGHLVGHGAVHQPLDHGRAPGTTLGDGEPGPRRHVPRRPAEDAMSSEGPIVFVATPILTDEA
jgi:PAS domain S-box-containing protein